ncbi:MAG TPA: hypothetical protein VG868_06520 [Casimicrobiaceae bacterium]|nr:hypothetical protein [Casimicrobiaceae bacterium]
MRDTLVRSLATSDRYWEEKVMHDQVCDIVEDLKAAGWPPERTIVAIKQVAAEAGLLESRSVLSLSVHDLDARDSLMVKLVRWCIECYYDVQQFA